MLEDVLRSWGGYEVSAMDVYRDIFRLDLDDDDRYLQLSGEPAGGYRANPVGYFRNQDEEKGHFRVFFHDTFEEVLQELQEADFSILNGLTYFGRRNVQQHASKMFAMIFDLDGVTPVTLNNFMSGAHRARAYPVPNYVALSGHGVHLYYVFEEPVELYPYLKLQLKELKYAITDRIWNPYNSTEEKVQHQGINQGFRVIGGKTKIDGVRVRAFRMNEHPFTIRQLCEFVPPEKVIDDKKLFKESRMTLEQARKKYPEWYEKVVVRKNKTPTLWDIAGKVNGDNPYALYDWWKAKILAGASYRHRYFAIMALAIYGAKCDKPYEEVEKDALALVPFLNEINTDEPFTKEDCYTALECYDARYCTFPIRDIEKITAIPIERNKRNGRRQKVHLGRARAVQQFDDPEGSWRNKDGRPRGSGTAEQCVAEYRAEHPEASVTEVARALQISRPTVYKWWNAVPASAAIPEGTDRMDEKIYRYTPGGIEEADPEDLLRSLERRRPPRQNR